jgi:hypothetical protein
MLTVQHICAKNYHGYVPLVIITIQSCLYLWFITHFVTRVTWWVPLVEQELFVLPKYMSSPMFLSGDHVFLVFCVKCTAWYYRSMYSGRVSSSCSTSGTCCVNLVTNLRKEVDCESLLDSWKQHVLEFHSREINIYNITWKSMFMLLKNRTEIYM